MRTKREAGRMRREWARLPGRGRMEPGRGGASVFLRQAGWVMRWLRGVVGLAEGAVIARLRCRFPVLGARPHDESIPFGEPVTPKVPSAAGTDQLVREGFRERLVAVGEGDCPRAFCGGCDRLRTSRAAVPGTTTVGSSSASPLISGRTAL